MEEKLNERLLDASKNDDVNKVKELLDSGADKDAKNNYGWTPLIRACAHVHLEVVKLLLEYGADKEAKNNYGSTPLIIASFHGYTEVVKLLLEYGAVEDCILGLLMKKRLGKPI